MKAILAGLGSLILGLSLSHGALAQEQIPPPQFAPQAQVEVAPVGYGYGYPYAYAPRYGWGGPVAPRGWDGYRYGARIGHPWHGQWHGGGRAAYPHAIGHGGGGYGHAAHRR
jgi:hypothetical protein